MSSGYKKLYRIPLSKASIKYMDSVDQINGKPKGSLGFAMEMFFIGTVYSSDCNIAHLTDYDGFTSGLEDIK